MSKELMERIEKLKTLIVPVLERYPVVKAGLFGSVIRHDFEKDSDIDILVEIEEGAKMGLEYVGMKLDLEDAVGRKVDVVQYKLITPIYKPYILPNEVRIYEKDSTKVPARHSGVLSADL